MWVQGLVHSDKQTLLGRRVQGIAWLKGWRRGRAIENQRGEGGEENL
jgi:hypothetical protein